MNKLFALLVVSLTFFGSAFGQTYTMVDNYNQTVTGCSGTVTDGGGNYNNNVEATLTICSGIPGQGVILDFTQFNLENNYDDITIYDGTNTGAPVLGVYTGTTMPPQIVSSQECITIYFDTDGSVTRAGFTINISCGVIPSCSDGIQNQGESGIDCGGCFCPSCPTSPGAGSSATLTASADVYNLPCGGGPVNLSALGEDFVPVLNSDFNNGTPGPGWQTTPGGAQYDNPCGPGPNGSHLWFGSGTAAPRELITAPLDLRCGGEICFYLKMEPEASGDVSPCEGSDEYDEGVSVQWSNADCSGWNDFMYFAPVGDLITTYPGNGVNSPGATGQTPFTTWQQYCSQVPPGAWTPSTQIRWYQWGSSGTGFDHWGLDEVTINADACLPYFYDWEHIPGFPDSPDNLVNPTVTTTYTVHYTNGVDDTVTTQVTIVVDGVQTPGVAITEEACMGDNDASVSITANGGTPNYSVNLVGPAGYDQTQASAGLTSFTNLAPGLYTVTITDNAGCTSDTSFTINPGPTCCTTTATPADLTCNQNNAPCDGQGTANPTGVAPFSYQWYTGNSVAAGTPIAGQTNQTAAGLCPGTYTVEITDNSSCTAEATITITEPTEVEISLVGTDPLCNGATNGTINASAVGGAGGYVYSQDGTTFAGTSTFNVGAGTYTIYVEDANGCPDQDNITINEPPVILPAIDAVNNSSCGQADGGFTISATGGTAPYTFTEGGTTNATGVFTAYAAGTYTVTVEDDNGCTETINVTVSDDAGPTASLDNFVDALCFGIPDGSATVVSAGGTAPITYSIDGGAFGATNTFNGLSAGSHTVTVEDDNGCQDAVTFTISQPTQVSFTATPVDVNCNGACDGEIQINPSGGTPPYEFSADFGLTYTTNNPITGLCAGNITVVVRDDNGCNVNQNYVINEPVALSASSVGTDASCNGASDGTVVVTAQDGTAPYQYSIDGGALQASNTFNGLAAGTYQIDVVDDNGCIHTHNVTVNEPAPMDIALDLNNNSTCSLANGEINVSATGGDGNYTFTIDGGSPNATGIFPGLAAGTYTLAVTDGNGCSDNMNVTVVDEPDPVLDATVTDVSCNGASDGSVLVNVISGGTAPFQYSDDNVTFGASNNFTGLPSGTYTFYVQDDNGCTDDITVNITEPNNSTVNFTPADNSCFNACDGTVTVNVVSGGVAPYEYSSNGGVTWQLGNTLTGLCVGVYDIQVRDAGGCLLVSSNETINEPAEIIPNPVSVEATCGLNNGEVTLAASGGVGAPYTYDFQVTGTFNGTTNYTGLAPGTYNFEVQDASGCIVPGVINVGSADAPTIDNTTFVGLDCNGDTDGEITVEASGGVGTIDYNINGGPFVPVGASPGPVTNTYTNLGNGTYTVGVQDDNGCVVFTTVNISNPNALNYNTVLTHNPCNGDLLGEINVVANGGTGTIYYSLNGGAPVTTNTFTGLAAGTYTMDVTDDNGCVISSNEDITEPPLLDITNVTGTDALCFGSSDGTIDITAVGGTAPILYSVDNGVSFQPGGSFTGLPAGTYDILVEDDNGCQHTDTYTINEPVDLTFAAPTTNSTCSQNNGVITVNAADGTAPYEYSYDGGATFGPANTYTDFAGSYDVVVRDDNGCLETATIIIIDEPAATIDNIAEVDPLCFGSLDGTITITATGTAPLTYGINGGAAQAANVFIVGSGAYTIEVYDGNGCLTTGNATLTDPPQLTISTNQVDVLCNGDATGSIQIVAGGGTGVLNYSIDNGTTFNTPANNFNFINITAGNYTAYVEDANGCTITSTVTINEPAPLVANAITPIDDSCFNACVGMIAFDVQGGVTPYSYSQDGLVFTSNDTIFDLCANNYTATVTDDNGCTITQPIVINEPTEVTLALATSNETCDAVNGVITATGNGGTAPLTYFLDGGAGQAANVFNGVDNGNHNVLVEDAFGCSATGNVNVIADPIPLITSVALTDPLCNGSADGTATVSISGGVGTILYSVDGGATQASNVFNTLSAGAHTAEIIDDNGCTHTFPFNLTDPPVLQIDNITTVDVDCNGNTTGSFEVFASGGTPGYTYSFDGGTTFQGSSSNNFIGAGSYDVVVEDANGCQVGPQTVDIFEPLPLDWDPTITVVDASCFGVCDGTINAPVTGGTAPYSYNWSGNVAGANDVLATALCAGNYGVIVTDDNGCQIQDLAVTVNEPPLLVINSAVADSVSCFGFGDGVITIDAPLGVSFTIDNGANQITNATGFFDGDPATGTDPDMLPVGLYNITVTDAQGCEAYTNVTIYQPDSLIVSLGLDITICTNIPIILSPGITGGTQAYSYQWGGSGTGTQPTITINQTQDESYDVTVTDANGCTASDTKNVFVIPPMLVDPIVDDTICPGEDITYSATAQFGDQPYYFTWSVDNFTDTVNTVTFTPTQSVTPLTLNAKDNCGTDTSITVNVYWYDYPSFDVIGATDGCVEHTVNLENTMAAFAASNCFWDFGDGNTSTSCGNVTHTYTEAGIYSVSLSFETVDGCVLDSVFTDLIEVYDLPEANFTWAPTDATIMNPTVNFTNLSVGADTYAWNFGGYGSSTDENPTFVFPGDSARSYYTCLTAFANHPTVTCVDNFCAEVKIKEDFLLYVPNAFTPDGDPFNQTFKAIITGIDVYDFEMLIFDRWGELIFESHNKEVGWDGTFQGNLVQDGVYVWKIKLKIEDVDDRKTYFGHVSVLR